MTYKWRLVALLFCCGALNYGDRAATSTVLPLFRSELGMSEFGMAGVGSLFLWSYAFGSPFAGRFADRFSRSKLVVFSLIAWSLITLITGFVTSVNQLLLTRALLGIAECVYLPASIALIADYHDAKTRATALGIHAAGLSIGLVAGGSVSGYLGAHYGWQAAFKAFGVLGLLFAVLAHRTLRDIPRDPLTPSTPRRSPKIRELLRIPTYAIIVGEALLVAIANNIFANWLPLYFKESYHMSLTSAGFSGTFLLQFSSVLGAALGGVLSDKVAAGRNPRRMLVQIFFFLCSAPLLFVFVAQPALSVISAAIFAFGLLRAIGSANESPLLCDLLDPGMRSTAIGVMNTTNCFAGGLGVLLAGFLMRDYGLGAVFAGSSVVMIGAAGLLAVGYRVFVQRDLARDRSLLAGQT